MRKQAGHALSSSNSVERGYLRMDLRIEEAVEASSPPAVDGQILLDDFGHLDGRTRGRGRLRLVTRGGQSRRRKDDARTRVDHDRAFRPLQNVRGWPILSWFQASLPPLHRAAFTESRDAPGRYSSRSSLRGERRGAASLSQYLFSACPSPTRETWWSDRAGWLKGSVASSGRRTPARPTAGFSKHPNL